MLGKLKNKIDYIIALIIILIVLGFIYIRATDIAKESKLNRGGTELPAK